MYHFMLHVFEVSPRGIVAVSRENKLALVLIASKHVYDIHLHVT